MSDPGDFEQIKRGVTFREGEGKPGAAWQTREPVVTPDVANDPVFRPRDAAVACGMSSLKRVTPASILRPASVEAASLA